ncbi:replication-relaxation family protein [Candidatus Saccharibacteria bacterium]|nr:replication-relaxation family protein [Candidatus Saccharibacteria bacterium]
MARQLNDKQLNILELILRFRYATTDNLASTRNITANSAYSALEILHKAGYIGKLHEKSYRLQNKSARYFLTSQAIDYLRNEVGSQLPDSAWKARSKDANRSAAFVDQQVAIHGAYNVLHGIYGDSAQIMTALEMGGEEGIIRPLPGLRVRPTSCKKFFVELTDGQHLFIAKKRIRKYIQNYDDGDWEWDEYPDVYMVRASSAAERTALRKYAAERMEDAYLDEDDFSFHVVTSVAQIKRI